MISKITKFIVTGFYVGLIRIAPGTFGSLLAFPILILLLNLSTKYKLKVTITSLIVAQQELLAVAALFVCTSIFLFFIGIYLSNLYIKETGREDPKEVVIDEIVGQMLTVILSFFTSIFAHNSYLAEKISGEWIDFIFLFLLPFCLFRFFDIFKPWPINWIDQNVKGGLGVMLDDVVAGIFAAIMCYAFTFVIVGNYTDAQ